MFETFSKLQQFVQIVQFLTFPAVRSEASFEVPSFWVRFFSGSKLLDRVQFFQMQVVVVAIQVLLLVYGRRKGTLS